MFAVVAATAFAFVPRTARACGRGGGYGGLITAVMVGAIVVGGVDIGLTVFDAASAGSEHSTGYGVVETMIAAPQFALGIAALSSTGGNSSGGLVLYTLWMGFLTTHGIWTIASSVSASPPPIATIPGAEPPQTEPAPLLQVALGPTYVPVGQLAQPGFGLVGRF